MHLSLFQHPRHMFHFHILSGIIYLQKAKEGIKNFIRQLQNTTAIHTYKRLFGLRNHHTLSKSHTVPHQDTL